MKKFILFPFIVIFLQLIGTHPLFAQLNIVPDLTFGANGIKYNTPVYQNDDMFDMEVQVDGRIITTGFSGNTDSLNTMVRRFLGTGEPDSSFGGTGYIFLPYKNAFEERSFLKPLANGKILVSVGVDDYNLFYVYLVRLNNDGSVDNSFGNHGFIQLSDLYSDAALFTVLGDGSIITERQITFDSIHVVKYDTAGVADSTFGGHGYVVNTLGLNRITAGLNNEIYMGGIGADSAKMTVLRYTAAGEPDSSFGQDGRFTFNALGVIDNEPLPADPVILPLQDGSLYLVFYDSRLGVTGVIHLLQNGTIDANYGNNGEAFIDFAGAPDKDAVLINDELLITGDFTYHNFNNGTMSVLTSTGAIDSAFSGRPNDTCRVDVLTNYNTTYSLSVRALAGNKILLGLIYYAPVSETVFERFDYNSIATGANELGGAPGFQLYPNPVNSIVVANTAIPPGEEGELQVFDATGRLLINKKITGNSTNYLLETIDWHSGMYFVVLRTMGQSITRKLTVIH